MGLGGGVRSLLYKFENAGGLGLRFCTEGAGPTQEPPVDRQTDTTENIIFTTGLTDGNN